MSELDDEIRAYEEQLAALDRQRDEVRITLNAFRRARDLMAGKATRAVLPSPVAFGILSTTAPEKPAPLASEPAIARRAQRTSETWERLVAECAGTGERIFTIEEILSAAQRANFCPTRGNVRSQLASYVNRELLDRVRSGVFRVTDAGRLIFYPPQALAAEAVDDGPVVETETAPPEKESAV